MFRIFGKSKINIFNSYVNFIANHTPTAFAKIAGNKNFSQISGKVEFFETENGTLVLTEINNLPHNSTGDFFAMHIHSGDSCNQDENGNFADSSHYNPQNYTHPSHAGDLPVLLSNNGTAFNIVLTKRFRARDIIGRTVFVHELADDFRTDPSGNSGTKIACGKIVNC